MKKESAQSPITRGLIIREPWVSMIVDGAKDWEMRTTATKIRGPVALIAAGTGKIIGVANLVAVEGPLSKAQMQFNQKRHRIPHTEIGTGEAERWNTAWVMQDAKRLSQPVDYTHPSGAVIWVSLDEKTQSALAAVLNAKIPAPRKSQKPRP